MQITKPISASDIGEMLSIASLILNAHDDYPTDDKAAKTAILDELERIFPDATRRAMAKVLTNSREVWLNQSPAASFGLSRVQWQAVDLINMFAKP